MDSSPALQASALCRSFGLKDVLRSLDFSLAPGERLALTGGNGSGKSTLIRCITGTLTPSSGAIRVCGHVAGTLAARRLVGASLSQERSFYLRLSGHANLVFFARLRHATTRGAEDQVQALEGELELRDIASERVDRCSTGMVQQLAFARSLLGEPQLLALDEPTRSLDAAALDCFWEALDRRPDLVLVLATHRSDDLHRCHERLALS